MLSNDRDVTGIIHASRFIDQIVCINLGTTWEQ
jgi:hypothetical protein